MRAAVYYGHRDLRLESVPEPEAGAGEVKLRVTECGSPIITEVSSMPDLTIIKAGTLDDTSWLDPKMHIFCDSAQRWSPIPQSSQQFPKGPPQS
jgi:hypothetical protein